MSKKTPRENPNSLSPGKDTTFRIIKLNSSEFLRRIFDYFVHVIAIILYPTGPLLAHRLDCLMGRLQLHATQLLKTSRILASIIMDKE